MSSRTNLFPNPKKSLAERIAVALEAFANGRAYMHVPCEETDVDIVLADCRERIEELEKKLFVPTEPITDEWLKEIGFKWHDVERSGKHWVLWLGDAVREPNSGTCREDLGLELTRNHFKEDFFYFCWLRGDYSHRYSRFLHVRHLQTRGELIRLIEGLTGLDWTPENVMFGALLTDARAANLRKESERLDRRMVEGSHPWNEVEKDESRGFPLIDHQGLIEKAEGKK